MEPILKQVKAVVANILSPIRDPFSRDIAGLVEASETARVEVRHGDVFELRAGPVRKRVGDVTVKMLAYNGSVPGPTLWVAQGSEVMIHFTNETEVETTVHWHGLRLDNRFDGVPEGAHQGMQAPIPTGGSFTYRLRFPDAGLYWYHPHIREDYAQEQGLYGKSSWSRATPPTGRR
jgi:FtsP/CotA-like multicopper oxidase with cupredoxin domain